MKTEMVAQSAFDTLQMETVRRNQCPISTTCKQVLDTKNGQLGTKR